MVNFILGFHCHQPIGNFDSVFKKIHEKSYSPLIRTLAQYNVNFCFHASGVLLEWWEKNDPELIKIIAGGVERGEIELIGGGYYEPVLASIPQGDRMKQLEMLSGALKRLFGKYPEGAWITERVWQVDIIKDLTDAGLNYAFLDDVQFFQAGISKGGMDKIFRTEYDGEFLDLFPIHERLRYKLPFAEPDESLNEVLYVNGRLSALSVMFDDGEKMGGWPDTYEWVYGKDGKKGWLDNFINLINPGENNPPVKFELPSRIIGNTTERTPVYLPASSYREMGEWTLSAKKRHYYEIIKSKDSSAPLCGGIWHNFLTRYPEANLFHKRMLHLSRKIDYAVKTYHKDLKEASEELLKSQANDAYWHGVFGGIYLPHLRRSIRNALIKSYVLYKDGIKKCIERELHDFDMDGEKEILLSNDYWLIIYKPSSGSFLALDYMEKDLIQPLGDVFCLHDEYDISKFKGNAERNGKERDGTPPQTIHKGVKYPSDLSESDLKVYSDLLPALEMTFNGGRLCFKNEFIEEDEVNKSISVKAPGFLKGGLESDNDPNKAFANLSIKIGNSIDILLASKPGIKGILRIILRFAVPGGSGPSVNVNIGGEIRGLNNYIEKEFNTDADNVAHISDSFWGGKIIVKHRASGGFLEKYNLALRPVTTISLSEKGFERIFQGIELEYSFNLTPEEDFSSIMIINIEKIEGHAT